MNTTAAKIAKLNTLRINAIAQGLTADAARITRMIDTLTARGWVGVGTN